MSRQSRDINKSYVAATRGRDDTQLYVTTEQLLALDGERPPAPPVGARDQLSKALSVQASELTATEVHRDSQASETRHRRLATRHRAAREAPVRRAARAQL